MRKKSKKITNLLSNGKQEKQRKIYFYLLVLFLLTNSVVTAQQVIPGIMYLNTLSEDAHLGENRIVQNDTLFSIFQAYGVTTYEQALPFAKNPFLWGVYKIECSGDVEELGIALEEQAENLVTDLMFVYEPEFNYQPEDDYWQDGKLWHLEKIQADSAWDLTRSSDSIDVSIMDFPPDIYHPDLATKINPPYNPLSGYVYHHMYAEGPLAHGTAIGGFVAGETTETGGIPDGKLASIGFNSNMMFYHFDGTSQIIQGVHASTVMGAEVITISNTFSGFNSPQPPETSQAMIQEILDNGTVIVIAAGNDPEYSQDNPYFDEIIIVSSTDSTDHFAFTKPNGEIQHHAHYPAVDLCAPGYNMYSANNTWVHEYVIDTATGDTTAILDSIPNWNLYPGWWSGTSFSAPITAGVAALIKSINPCLTPSDVQSIIKNTTDPIADEYLYSGELGTGRLNAYKAVKLAYDSYRFQNYTIQTGQNIAWNDIHYIDTLYIEPNASLTITADCFFNVAGEVFVDTLAVLTINNATLTTTCGNIWNGIEVWGNINASQYPDTSLQYEQGRLFLNNATIENAHEAVSLWKDGDYNSTGGYVIAENSSFINNRRAVAFMSYHNYHPISLDPDRNFSRFDDCEFILDENYFGDSPFHGMVSLWDVEGVGFNGCDFLNNRDSIYNSSGVLINDSLSGFGIWSVDGGFEVGPLCNSQTSPCPPQDVDSCYFAKFEYGIHSINTKSKNTIAVKSSSFDYNITGLYTSGLMQPSIIFNTFNIVPVSPQTNKIYGGLYLDNTTGFIVEENYFNDNQGPSGSWTPLIQSVGLCVNNSGSDNNLVYNNTFENLYVGALAQNHNRSNDLFGEFGLEYHCNEFFNIQFDIAVTADNPDLLTSGIRGNQGSDGSDITDPAGNIFSPYNEQPTVEAWDIYTETNRVINYWYHATQNNYDLRPDSVTQFLVTVNPNTNAEPFMLNNACPSNFTTGGGIDDLKLLVDDMNYKADSVSDLLSLLVDGGDTETTKTNVETAWPDETMEIRDDLLNKSPYLSDSVMVTAVQQEDVLPAAIVTEILTSNPQSAKSDNILDEVYARTDITNSQIDQIEANNIVTGAKESLEIKLAQYKGQRSYALNRLITLYKTDTSIINPADSIINILNDQDFASAKYQMAFEYLGKGELQLAQNTLAAIDDNYDLYANALAEHTQLETYMGLMVQLAQTGNNIFQLSNAQKSSLYNIHQNSSGLASTWAKNILLTVDTLSCKESYLLPTASNKTSVVRRKRPDNLIFDNTKLKVYPNPANDYVIVEYQMEGDNDRAVIKIIDNNGFIRQAIEQENNHGYSVIDTRSLESGTYICHISSNGILIGVAKFIILR